MWISGLMSAICYSLMSLVIAHFGDGISASEFLLGRSIVGLVLLAPFLLKSKFKSEFSLMLLMRGIIGTIAIFIFFIMIQNVGAGTATAIHYTSPMYIALLGVLFMKEKINIQKLVALALVMIGVLIPAFSHFGILSTSFLILGSLGAIFSGVSFFILKIMTSKSSEVVIYWMFCLIQLAIQIPMHFLSKNPIFHIRFSFAVFSSIAPPCLAVGFLACIAQLLMNRSFKALSATTASLLNLLNIPFTVLIEQFAFHKQYNELHYWMILLIFAGILMLRLRSNPPNFLT